MSSNAPVFEVVNIDPTLCNDPSDDSCPKNAWVRCKDRIAPGALRIRGDDKYQDFRIMQYGAEADTSVVTTSNANASKETKRKRAMPASVMFETGPVILEFDVTPKASKWTSAAPTTEEPEEAKKPKSSGMWCNAAFSLDSIPGMEDRIEDVRETLARATSQRIIQDLRKGTADVNVNIRPQNSLLSMNVPFNDKTSVLDVMVMEMDGTVKENVTKLERQSTVNIVFMCEIKSTSKGCAIHMTVCQIMMLRVSLNRTFLMNNPVFSNMPSVPSDGDMTALLTQGGGARENTNEDGEVETETAEEAEEAVAGTEEEEAEVEEVSPEETEAVEEEEVDPPRTATKRQRRIE